MHDGDDEDDERDEPERGRILQFPRRPATGGDDRFAVTADDVVEDEADAFTRMVLARHLAPRIAEEVLPLLPPRRDDEESAAMLVGLRPIVPDAALAQIVAYAARNAETAARRFDRAADALRLDDENLDARLIRSEAIEDPRERLAALDAALATAEREPPVVEDAWEPLFVRIRRASRARAMVARSDALRDAGRFEEALAAAAAAADEVPHDDDAAVALAAAALCLGDGARARRCLAPREDPSGDAEWGLVLAAWLEGDLDAALDQLAVARRAAPRLEAVYLRADDAPAFDASLLRFATAWSTHPGAVDWLAAASEPAVEVEDGFIFAAALPRDDDGALESDAAEQYGERLIARFLTSTESRELRRRGVPGDAVHFALLDSLAHLGKTPAEWRPDDLDGLLDDAAGPPDPDDLEALRAFLRFLRRRFDFAAATALLARLDAR